MPRIGIKTESRTVVTKGWGRGQSELLFSGYGVSVWDEVKVPKTLINSGDGCATS